MQGPGGTGRDGLDPGRVLDAALAQRLGLVVGTAALLLLGSTVLGLSGGPGPLVLLAGAGAALGGFGALGLRFMRRPVPAGAAHPVAATALLAAAGLVLLPPAVGGWLGPAYAAPLVALAALLPRLHWFLAVAGVMSALAGLFWLAGPAPAPPAVLAWVGAAVAGGVVRREWAGAVLAAARARRHAADVAVRDPLTAVANRQGLALLGRQILEAARRQGDAVHCLSIEVDGISRLAETEGREAVDDVLLATAEALRANVRGTDVVARVGEAAFCVVGPGVGSSPPALERRLASHTGWSAGVSVGAAVLAPWDAGSLDGLLARADREMRLRRAVRRGAAGAASANASATD